MLVKGIKYLLGILLAGFISLNLLLGCFGVSSVLLTLTVYFLLGLLLWLVLRWIFHDRNRRSNARLVMLSLLLSLLAAELSLRYIFRQNLSYSEANRQFFYSSMYRRGALQNVAQKWFPDHVKEMTVVNRPHAVKVLKTGDFTYTYRYNSLGLKGPEPEADSSKTVFLALGDSFTEGQGAPPDSGWPEDLGRIFRSRHFFHREVEMVNGGLAGSDVFFEYRLLTGHLLPLHPDIVMLSINTSDIVDVTVRGGMERFGPQGRLHYNDPPWWEYIYQFSFVFRSMLHAFGDYDWMLQTPEQHRKRSAEAVRKIRDCILQQYLPLAKREKFKLIVVLHPGLYELEQDAFPFDALSSDTSLTDRVRVIDLMGKFRDWHGQSGQAYRSIF